MTEKKYPVGASNDNDQRDDRNDQRSGLGLEEMEIRKVYLQKKHLYPHEDEVRLSINQPRIFHEKEFGAGIESVIYIKMDQPDKIFYDKFYSDYQGQRYGIEDFIDESEDKANFDYFKGLYESKRAAIQESADKRPKVHQSGFQLAVKPDPGSKHPALRVIDEVKEAEGKNDGSKKKGDEVA